MGVVQPWESAYRDLDKPRRQPYVAWDPPTPAAMCAPCRAIADREAEALRRQLTAQADRLESLRSENALLERDLVEAKAAATDTEKGTP